MGCRIGEHFVGDLANFDLVTMIVPSRSGVRILINVSACDFNVNRQLCLSVYVGNAPWSFHMLR